MNNRKPFLPVFLPWTCAIVLCTAAQFCYGQWPQFGGPQRNFSVKTARLAQQWPDAGPTKLWTRDLGEGYSGIVGSPEAIYTMYRQGDNDVIVALAADTGSVLWEHKYEAKPDADASLRFGTGPNATPLLNSE